MDVVCCVWLWLVAVDRVRGHGVGATATGTCRTYGCLFGLVRLRWQVKQTEPEGRGNAPIHRSKNAACTVRSGQMGEWLPQRLRAQKVSWEQKPT